MAIELKCTDGEFKVNNGATHSLILWQDKKQKKSVRHTSPFIVSPSGCTVAIAKDTVRIAPTSLLKQSQVNMAELRVYKYSSSLHRSVPSDVHQSPIDNSDSERQSFYSSERPKNKCFDEESSDFTTWPTVFFISDSFIFFNSALVHSTTVTVRMDWLLQAWALLARGVQIRLVHWEAINTF